MSIQPAFGRLRFRAQSPVDAWFFLFFEFFARVVFLGIFAAALFSLTARAQAAEIPVGQYLDAGDFSGLDAALTDLQARFERAEANEVDLRDAYRPFYDLSDHRQSVMEQWERARPGSYAMDLARGVQLKQAGSRARGTRYISQTPDGNIQAMQDFFGQAAKHLLASLKETQKPYLSVFHLMAITGNEGDRDATRALLQLGNQMLPDNRLIRVRFMEYLAPKWGGSMEEMRAFIEQSRHDGATPEGVKDLEFALSSPCQCPRSPQKVIPVQMPVLR